MNNTTLRFTVVGKSFLLLGVVAVCLSSAACGVFSDDHDRVLEGSLTLTPLRLPQDVAAPDNRNALVIPKIEFSSDPSTDQNELEKPPLLDVALASEMEKTLGSNVDQKKVEVKSFPVTVVEVDGGLAELTVDGDFDLLWSYMENVIEKLGFNVTDRNRSEHRYYISRALPETLEAKEQAKNTGVERSVGTAESYEVEVAPKEAAGASGKSSTIRILNNRGQKENSALARHILTQIKAYLEQPLQ